MTSTNCLLQKILGELEKLNKHIAIRTNAIAIIEIDTSITKIRSYSIQKEFSTRMDIIASQLTIMDVGGGFYIDTNNTGFIRGSVGYVVENETINSLEIYGTGTIGIAKLRLGATI